MLKELFEKKVALAAEVKRMADAATKAGKPFTGEEKANWDKVNADYDAAKQACEIAERAEKIEREMSARPEPKILTGQPERAPESRQTKQPITDEQRAIAMKAWARAGRRDVTLSEEEEAACRAVEIGPRQDELLIRLPSRDDDARRTIQAIREHRDLSVGTTTAGGFTVPQGFVPALEQSLLWFGSMRVAGSIIRTDSGNPLPWPTASDTGNTGALLAENTATTEADPTFGQVVFQAYKYSSKMVQVSTELLEDSAFNMAAELGRMLGDRIGRILNTQFTTGTNSSQPMGLMSTAAASAGNSVGVTAAATNAITAEEVMDLYHSVDIAYRNQPKTAFMAHDGIIKALRKLRESGTTGQFLWQPGMQLGIPDRLLGAPVYTNNDMQATLATGTKTLVFGNFDKYKIRDVTQMRLLRLNERYADSDQVAFVLFSRHDGRILDAGTDPFKYLIMA